MHDISSTILLVEDSADDADTFRRALTKANIDNALQVVDDGREAMAYLAGEGRFADRERFPIPFIIFLDLRLPRRDGLEVMAWMRERPALSAIAVVVLTVSEDGLDHQKAYALGARSYLLKPPSPDELQRLMASMEIYYSRFGDAGPRFRSSGSRAAVAPKLN